MNQFLVTFIAINVDKPAHKRLVQFQHEQGLSMSQAVALLLETILGYAKKGPLTLN